MIEKLKILVFVDNYLPGYKSGGPLRSIVNMVSHLSEEFDFAIVTSDRDLGDETPFENIKLNSWIDVDGAKVFYASPSTLSFVGLSRVIRSSEYDVVYLNSFFSVNFSMKPLLLSLLYKKMIILAPRGEFSPGALAIKSNKKSLYLKLVNLLGLYGRVTWQASSDFEKCDISNVIWDKFARVVVAEDLPGKNIEVQKKPPNRKFDQPLQLVFISRISPKKNLDYALKILAKVKYEVNFVIYGVIEDLDYWKSCTELIEQLPYNISVVYKGSVRHEEVVNTLSNYDMFFFPTKGENYGHVIHEAFLAGLPVLTSDQTPWRDLREKGVGFDFPLSEPDLFVELIENIAMADDETRKKLFDTAYDYGISISGRVDVVARNTLMFHQLFANDSNRQSGPKLGDSE